MKVSDRLTDIAELICAEALSLSWQQITASTACRKYGPMKRACATPA